MAGPPKLKHKQAAVAGPPSPAASKAPPKKPRAAIDHYVLDAFAAIKARETPEDEALDLEQVKPVLGTRLACREVALLGARARHDAISSAPALATASATHPRHSPSACR